MMKKIFGIFLKKKWVWIAAVGAISALSLFMAYIFEYVGGLKPCHLCFAQRHAHIYIVLLILLALLATYVAPWSKMRKELLLDITAFLIIPFGLYSFYVAFFHVGVEATWWSAPEGCSRLENSSFVITPDDIKNAFQHGAQLPGCAEVPWQFFGLSMAGYNAIVSLFQALGTVILIITRFFDKRMRGV